MRGFITEKNWAAVDKTFPKAHRFYRHLSRKPQTFLELLELCHSFDDIDLNLGRRRRSISRRRNS